MKAPTMEEFRGNGQDDEMENFQATVINTFQPPEPPPPPPPTSYTAPPKEAKVDQLSAPTRMMQDVHPLAAATEIRPSFSEPPRPPMPPPATPVPHPLTQPIESKPVPPVAAKPPAMQRYFYAAIAVFIFIAIVGIGILFFRKPVDETKAPPVSTPKQQTANQNIPVQPVQPEVEPITTGSLMVTSEPVGAKVFLGEEEKGVTPVEIPQLEFGTHTIRLELKGYQPLEQQVELTAENPNPSLPSFTMSKAVVNGTLIVDSEPGGAFIVIDNRVLGTTPKTFYRRPGNYNITLKKDGYLDYSGTAVVALNKKVTFRGTLAEIPKPEPVVEPPKPKKPEVTRGQLVTLGPDVIPPKPVKKIYAKYPEAAKSRRLGGTVRLNLLVDETGRVIDIKITKSAHEILDDAVVKAYQQWTFQPATKQGVPVKVWITVAMTFQSGR
jgi:TonB family protein